MQPSTIMTYLESWPILSIDRTLLRLGDFEQVPTDIIQRILSYFSLEDLRETLFEVCLAFRVITYEYLKYTVVCILDPSKPPPDLRKFHDTHKKHLYPLVEPEAMYIESGKLREPCKKKYPIRGLYSTDSTSKSDDAVLLKGIDTSQIVCITSLTPSIIGHLKNGEFPNCKLLTILAGKVYKMLPKCEGFSLLKYLDVTGCTIPSKNNSRPKYGAWLYFATSLQTFVSSASDTFLPHPPNLEKYIVHLLEKPSPFQHVFLHPNYCSSIKHYEILSNLLNPNPDEKQYVGLPLNSGLTTFICTATPNQVICYVDPSQYGLAKPERFDMEDDEYVINYYNWFAGLTKIIVHRGFSWEIRIGSNKTLTVTFNMVTLPEGTVVQYLESPSEVPLNTINKL